MKRVAFAVLLVLTLNLAAMATSAQFGVWVSKKIKAGDYGTAAISAGTGYLGAAGGAWAGTKLGVVIGGTAGGPVGAFIGAGVGAIGGAL